ncbi:MAG: hypothetical protein AAFX78_03460 [Cyanobacteria bacterium J06638_20]
MNQGFTGISNVLVAAGSLRIFQAKVRELDCQEIRQNSAVINGVRFLYVEHSEAARGFDRGATRYLDLYEAWLKPDLLDALQSTYSKLTEEEFDWIHN